MKPLLAHTYEPHRVTYPCYVQPKLNGIRALYKAGHFQSRDQLPFPVDLLRHLSEPLVEVFGEGDASPVLDGELYVHGWPLQRINAAVTPIRQKPTEDTKLVEYHVFDVVDFGKRFTERRSMLFSLEQQPRKGDFPWLGGIEKVFRVRTDEAYDEQIANEWYARYVRWGYEGMMYRLGDCPYTVSKQRNEATPPTWTTWNVTTNSRFLSDKDNRCWHLLKRKDWHDDEFEAVRLIEGEGKLQGMLGAIECVPKIPITYRGYQGEVVNKTFSVGSGLTDAERAHYWTNPDLVLGHKIKVKYLVLSSDGIPLNPTILAVL